MGILGLVDHGLVQPDRGVHPPHVRLVPATKSDREGAGSEVTQDTPSLPGPAGLDHGGAGGGGGGGLYNNEARQHRDTSSSF